MKKFVSAIALTAILVSLMTGVARAAVTVSAATGGEAISADTANGSFTALTGPTISENASGDIRTGTVVLRVPTGFAFATSAVRVKVTPGSSPLTVAPTSCGSASRDVNVTPTATTISFTVCSVTTGSSKASIQLSGVRVQPTAGTPLASGDIVLSSTSTSSIVGVTPNVTSFGRLTEVAGALAAITLSPSPATAVAGTTLAFAAQTYDQFGNPRSDAITWSARASAGTINAAGVLNVATTAAEITDAVTAAAGTLSVKTNLTIMPDAISRIEVDPATTRVPAGTDVTYTVTGYDQHGNAINGLAGDTTFTAASGATCSANVCASTAVGSYAITASHAAGTDEALLEIDPAAAVALAIAPADAEIVAGGNIAYTASASDAYGNAWTVPAAFSLNGDTCADAICSSTVAGTHAVSAAWNDLTASTDLVVTPGALTSLELTPADATTTAGEPVVFSAHAYDAHGNDIGDVSGDAAFTLDGVACDGASCLATEAGTYTVRAQLGETFVSTSLTVEPGPLARLAISPQSAEIVAGTEQAYTAAAFDAYGNSLGDVTGSTLFTIGGVPCIDATCSSTQARAHEVIGTYDGITDDAELTVVPAATAAITVSPAEVTVVAGEAAAFTSDGFDQYGNHTGDLTADTTFTANDEVCEGGECLVTTAGTWLVQATHSAWRATATLTVEPAALDRIELSPEDATIEAGQAVVLQTEGFDSFGNTHGDLTSETTFSSDASCTLNTCGGEIAGLYDIVGSVGELTDTAALTIVPAALHDLAVTLTPATIVADGESEADLRIVPSDVYGNRRLDDAVAATTSGDAAIGGIHRHGDELSAHVTASTTAGVETITVTAGALSEQIDLTEVAGAPALLSLLADDAVVTTAAGGRSTTTLRARLTDAFGNPVEGSQLSFAITSYGSGLEGTPLAPTVGSSEATDASGRTTAQYSAGYLPGTDEIAVTLGDISSTIEIHVRAGLCSEPAPQELCPEDEDGKKSRDLRTVLPL